MKTNCIIVRHPGSPETMELDKIKISPPAPGEVLLRQHAIGVNFIDVYHRNGFYPVPELPFTPGLEAAGEIIETGENVKKFRIGQRVAYAFPPIGAYSEIRTMPADRLIPLPDAISYEQAAAMMLKGMTAEYLIRRTYPVKKGETILIHAAAGGVGQILCQWAKHIGARIIGTVGSPEKAEIAKSNGCDHPILYREKDFAKEVMEYTDGQGVPVVYDSVGKDTFEKSLECISIRGHMVNFGQSSGPSPEIDPVKLSKAGSLYLTRPSLMHYNAKREDLLESGNTLLKLVSSEVLKIPVSKRYQLKNASQAHKDLEERKTSGSNILVND